MIDIRWAIGFAVTLGGIIFAWGKTWGTASTHLKDHDNQIKKNGNNIKNMYGKLDEMSNILSSIKTDISWLKMSITKMNGRK